MNGEDIQWLEKLFEQHKEDQKIYLDAQFKIINEKLDKREVVCEKCRACIDASLEDLEDDLVLLEVDTDRKIIIGSVIAVLVSLGLWAIFGTEALQHVIDFIGRIL